MCRIKEGCNSGNLAMTILPSDSDVDTKYVSMIDKLTKTVNTIAVTNEQLTTALANKEAECKVPCK